VKCLNSHNFSFALKILFNVNGKSQTHPWLMSGKVSTFDFGICLRNIPGLVGTFQGIFESHSCKETCDVHVKSPNNQQAMKFTHLGLLVIEPFWSKLVLTQKWVSLSWEATHVGIMTYTKVMQKQPYSGSPNPIIHSFNIHFSTFDGCKKLSLPCGVNEMQFFLEFRFAAKLVIIFRKIYSNLAIIYLWSTNL